jgi:hypothetical protein
MLPPSASVSARKTINPMTTKKPWNVALKKTSCVLGSPVALASFMKQPMPLYVTAERRSSKKP